MEPVTAGKRFGREIQDTDASMPLSTESLDLDSVSFFTQDIIDQSALFSPSFNVAPSSVVLPAADVTGHQNEDTLAYLVHQIRSYTTSFVYQSRTPFIHERIYRNRMPQVLQGAFTICAVYLTINRSNKSTVFQIIEAKAADLLQRNDGPAISIADSLACVQALILVQIVQLFDGDIRQRAIAEQNESTLAQWTEQLQSLVFQTEVHQRASQFQDWQSWIFAESVRRTIMTSHLIRKFYETLKLGYSTGAARMAPMTFTAQAAQWDLPLEDSLQNSSSPPLPLVSSYYDFILKWERGQIGYMETFERVLLVACKGEESSKVVESDLHYSTGIAC